MSKYHKKPITIEAFKFDGDLIFSNGTPYAPNWAIKAWKDERMYYDEYKGSPGALFIKTSCGDPHVNVGDYVILYDNGELGVCESTVFDKTYEIIEE